MKYKSKIFQVLVIGLATLILSIVHIHNGFPFLLTDSFGYLRRASGLMESSHWSNTYVAYVAFCIHVLKSVNIIIIVQNLITSISIYLFCKKFISKINELQFLLIITSMCFTSLIWTSNMLMSDIFTPISLLTIFTLLFAKLNRIEVATLGFIGFISFSSHQSHIIIIPLYFFSLLLLNLVFKRHIPWSTSNKRILLLVAIFVTSLIFEKNIMNLFKEDQEISSTNEVGNNDELDSKKEDIYSGYYFVAVRISQSGMLNKILDDFCKTERGNYLCERDTMYSPIYIKSTSIVSRNSENEDYLKLARDNKELVLYSLRKPAFYYGMFKIFLFKGLDLMVNTNIRNFKVMKLKDRALEKFKSLLDNISPGMSKDFMQSKQMRNIYKRINKSIIGKTNILWWKILTPLLLLICIYVFLIKKDTPFPKEILFLILALVLAHAINTAVCSTFSNSNNVRYSARSIWLVSFAICIAYQSIFSTSKKITQLVNNETNSTDTLL